MSRFPFNLLRVTDLYIGQNHLSQATRELFYQWQRRYIYVYKVMHEHLSSLHWNDHRCIYTSLYMCMSNHRCIYTSSKKYFDKWVVAQQKSCRLFETISVTFFSLFYTCFKHQIVSSFMRWACLKLCSFQNGAFIKLTRQKSHRRTDSEQIQQIIHRRTDSEYSESSSKISSEEEIEEVTEVPRKRCKTRGGKTVTPSRPAKSQKEICELESESTRKEQDLALIVPQFTRQSKVHAELPHPSPLNFLDTYFDESFYELLVTQASSHAHQYMQMHANLLLF